MYELLSIILPYLLLFYVIDCFAVLTDGHSAFSSFLGARYRFSHSGIHLLTPFPVSELYIASTLPFFLSDTHVHVYGSNTEWHSRKYCTENRTSIAYEAISSVTLAEDTIALNGQSLFRFPNKHTAKTVFDLITQAAKVESSQRLSLFRNYSTRTIDWQNLTEKHREAMKRTACLKLPSSALFVVVFGFAPLITYSPMRTTIDPLWVLAPIVALYAATAITGFVLLRKMQSPSKGQFRTSLILAILSPVGVLHLAKEYTKNALSTFDYLAVAALLLPVEEFRLLARQELHALSLSRMPDAPSDILSRIRSREEQIGQILQAKCLTPDILFSPPRKFDPSAKLYCPVCLVEYVQDAQHCTACEADLRKF